MAKAETLFRIRPSSGAKLAENTLNNDQGGERLRHAQAAKPVFHADQT
jgi:hypothetical protein